MCNNNELTIKLLKTGRNVIPRGFQSGWICPSFWTFSTVMEGRTKLEFMKRPCDSTSIPDEDELSVLPPLQYRWEVVSDCDAVIQWMNLKVETACGLDPLSFLDLPERLGAEFFALRNEMTFVSEDNSVPDIIRNIKLQSLALQFVRLLFDSFPASPNIGAMPSQSLQDAVAFMEKHLDSGLRISDAARAVGLSPGVFYKKFKSFYGVTPYAFFDKLRLKKAVSMLADESIPIKQIATQLGYSDRFQFSKRFKQMQGITPALFRRDVQRQYKYIPYFTDRG